MSQLIDYARLANWPPNIFSEYIIHSVNTIEPQIMATNKRNVAGVGYKFKIRAAKHKWHLAKWALLLQSAYHGTAASKQYSSTGTIGRYSCRAVTGPSSTIAHAMQSQQSYRCTCATRLS